MAAIGSAISLEEYLRTAYRPDVEYIDGYLGEKPMPTLLHGIVQMILGSWFLQHRKEWHILVASETRTEIDENRVRLPDVVVVHESEEKGSALRNAPLVAIEILSPKDSYADLRGRAADLRRMGVHNIWLIDPERRTGEIWNGKNWEFLEGSVLRALDSPIHLDLDWVWSQVDA